MDFSHSGMHENDSLTPTSYIFNYIRVIKLLPNSSILLNRPCECGLLSKLTSLTVHITILITPYIFSFLLHVSNIIFISGRANDERISYCKNLMCCMPIVANCPSQNIWILCYSTVSPKQVEIHFMIVVID